MATISTCAPCSLSSADELGTYFAKGSAYSRMADYLVGAAACFNVRSPLLLALGSLENHGVGTNWMTLGSTAISDFVAMWTANNYTKVASPSASEVEAVDCLNAAGAGYWYTHPSPGYSTWEGLLSWSGQYNGTCGCGSPYGTGYAWSSLFLAYGQTYDAAATTEYVGAFYVTTTGTAPVWRGCTGSVTAVTVPSADTTRVKRSTPYGGNSTGNQIVLLASARADQVSAWQMALNLHNAGFVQPIVTSDARFAAESSQNTLFCPIAVGVSGQVIPPGPLS